MNSFLLVSIAVVILSLSARGLPVDRDEESFESALVIESADSAESAESAQSAESAESSDNDVHFDADHFDHSEGLIDIEKNPQVVTRYDLGEVDIVLTEEQQMNLKHRSAYLNIRKWPNGVVPYVMDRSFSTNSKKVAAVKMAVKEYKKYTCIRLVPRTNEENYLRFISGQGCYSNIGVVGGHQDVSLGPGCDTTKGTPLHEVMHALGFMHEQQRPDRDSYIRILYDRIQNNARSNFDKVGYKEANLLNTTYDLGSVMHYPAFAFAIQNDITIETKDPSKQNVIGQRRGFAPCDIAKINRLYNCGGEYKTTC